MAGRYGITNDQILAAACMVLSGETQAIGRGTGASRVRAVMLNHPVSSANFFGVADEGRDSRVSKVLEGLGAQTKAKRMKKAKDAWHAFRYERRGTSTGECCFAYGRDRGSWVSKRRRARVVTSVPLVSSVVTICYIPRCVGVSVS